MRWRRRPIAVAADASNATINKVDARVIEEQGNEAREGGAQGGGGQAGARTNHRARSAFPKK